jgi:hypothetical protein
MNNEPQLCWQYPTGDCGETTRAVFLQVCSQNLAPVPSYPRHEEDDSTITPARWSFVLANLGANKQFNPVEFWRQCISFSVSAGHWYYTVASPFRLATETPTSNGKENSLDTNVTSVIKGGNMDFSLSFKAPEVDDTTASLKASFTVMVTLPEAVEIVNKGGNDGVRCSSNLHCDVKTKTERRTEPTGTKKLTLIPQRVTAVLVELNGAIGEDVKFQLSIPLRLMDDEADAKVLPAPVLEGSRVEIGDHSFTLSQNRKQQLGTPLVLLGDDDVDDEL